MTRLTGTRIRKALAMVNDIMEDFDSRGGTREADLNSKERRGSEERMEEKRPIRRSAAESR